MRRFRWPFLIAMGCLIGAAVGTGAWWLWFRNSIPLPRPLGIPSGDQEIAWLHNTTGGDTWALFVIGMKRCEMPVAGVPSELLVDDSGAFPEQSTKIPEIVIERTGCSGKLHIRWYKVAAEASIGDWIRALAERDPAPLAIIGGATSDRAHEIALALARQNDWQGEAPLLFLTTATVDTVLTDPDDPGSFLSVADQRNLVDVYPGKTFRFCFSNAQMVRAVTAYVLHDPTLRPGSIAWPQLRIIGEAAAGPWGLASSLADMARTPTVLPVEWLDDPYSGDLYNQFREHLYETLGGKFGPKCAPRIVRDPAFSIPFSIGGFSRTNSGEMAAVRAIARETPAYGERSLLILPTGGSAPMRRVLLALAERLPAAGRRLVALTGDGISVNTYYRDAEWAWPARSIPIPIVFFTHANPFGWDPPGGPEPPPGYRLEPRNSTEDVHLATTLGRTIADAILPANTDGPQTIAEKAADVAERLRTRSDNFFDSHGNRRGKSGEHVVVIRPTVRYFDNAPGTARPESTIEVFRREADGKTWLRVGSVSVLPERVDEWSSAE